MKKSHKKLIKKIIQAAVILIIFFFMFKRLYDVRGELLSYTIQINYLVYIIPAFLLLILAFFWSTFGWKKILSQLNETLGFRKAANIWLKAQLAKYIPGMIWYAAGRIYLSKKEGIPKTKTFFSLLLEIIFLVITALTIGLFVLLAYSNFGFLSETYLYFLVLPLGLLIIQPFILNYLLNFIKKAVKKKFEIKLKYTGVTKTFFIYFIRWLLMGAGFALFIKAIFPVSLLQMSYLAGIFAIAWVVGFLTIITPSGLGVREATLILLLQTIMPVSMAIICAFLARIWWMAGEVSSFAISSVLVKRK